MAYKDRWFCGRSQLLTTIIAWLHALVHLITLLVIITGCIFYFGVGYEFWVPKVQQSDTFHNRGAASKMRDPAIIKMEYRRIIAIWFGLCMFEHVLGFVAGVILIIGAKQGDPRKLKIWLWMTPFVLLLTGVNVLFLVFAIGENHSIIRMIGFFSSYCCIWPVVIRRKELLDQQYEEYLQEKKSNASRNPHTHSQLKF